MKLENLIPKVEGIALALAKEKEVYNVYLINQKDCSLEQVIINSKGYLIAEDGQETKTDTLRKNLGNIPAHSATMIEPILEEVLQLNNEFWVSFWIGDKMYDKKFVFLAEAIQESNFVNIPYLTHQGIVLF